ncbi:MAG: hypothetical protein HY985_05820 [Magnetospirillum sp.]|nr:hypothetical protein [Magnetospirillum sp.]
MRMSHRLAVLASIILVVSACGETRGERALSGAGIGAAAGAGTSAITGGNILGGAAIGGAAGGAAGALTKPEDLNLGKPLWQR